MKIKLFVTCEIQYFELGIFSFNSYVYYLSHGFIASTRAFNLPTRRFELVAREFELVTRNELESAPNQIKKEYHRVVSAHDRYKFGIRNVIIQL